MTLTQSLARQPIPVYRQYLRLTGVQQRLLAIKFERHVAACEKCGVEVDEAWIRVAILDVKR